MAVACRKKKQAGFCFLQCVIKELMSWCMIFARATVLHSRRRGRPGERGRGSQQPARGPLLCVVFASVWHVNRLFSKLFVSPVQCIVRQNTRAIRHGGGNKKRSKMDRESWFMQSAKMSAPSKQVSKPATNCLFVVEVAISIPMVAIGYFQ